MAPLITARPITLRVGQAHLSLQVITPSNNCPDGVTILRLDQSQSPTAQHFLDGEPCNVTIDRSEQQRPYVAVITHAIERDQLHVFIADLDGQTVRHFTATEEFAESIRKRLGNLQLKYDDSDTAPAVYLTGDQNNEEYFDISLTPQIPTEEPA